ncbi:glucokinase [Roseovarius mucosus]|uniref:glucokinase n=1 Tax=Roseovarius mucosus TaxID=215743 RepID=UPI001C5E7ED9|nr:glucokinase [Roseovarius mucosus]MBW4974520.1 glucokinase [Roseovarius mucosus]
MRESLVADVGASHTRVALTAGSALKPGSVQRFENAAFAGLLPILAAYLAEHGTHPRAICAGVAGPVRAGTAQLTNLDWFIDGAEMAHAAGATEVHLINDLQAQGYALDDLDPAWIMPVFAGHPDPNGPRMVLGLGTGSNIAVVHRVGADLLVPPAEAGHSGLPHLGDAANAVIAALGAEVAHKPYEALLSGSGLVRLHRLRSGVALTAPDILTGASQGQGACAETLALFLEILGAVMGNLALTHMATGGVFLIGGLARAMAPLLNRPEFRQMFVAKGPYRPIMEAMPIHLITEDTAALIGCARYLRQRLK